MAFRPGVQKGLGTRRKAAIKRGKGAGGQPARTIRRQRIVSKPGEPTRIFETVEQVPAVAPTEPKKDTSVISEKEAIEEGAEPSARVQPPPSKPAREPFHFDPRPAPSKVVAEETIARPGGVLGTAPERRAIPTVEEEKPKPDPEPFPFVPVSGEGRVTEVVVKKPPSRLERIPIVGGFLVRRERKTTITRDEAGEVKKAVTRDKPVTAVPTSPGDFLAGTEKAIQEGFQTLKLTPAPAGFPIEREIVQRQQAQVSRERLFGQSQTPQQISESQARAFRVVPGEELFAGQELLRATPRVGARVLVAPATLAGIGGMAVESPSKAFEVVKSIPSGIARGFVSPRAGVRAESVLAVGVIAAAPFAPKFVRQFQVSRPVKTFEQTAITKGVEQTIRGRPQAVTVGKLTGGATVSGKPVKIVGISERVGRKIEVGRRRFTFAREQETAIAISPEGFITGGVGRVVKRIELQTARGVESVGVGLATKQVFKPQTTIKGVGKEATPAVSVESFVEFQKVPPIKAKPGQGIARTITSPILRGGKIGKPTVSVLRFRKQAETREVSPFGAEVKRVSTVGIGGGGAGREGLATLKRLGGTFKRDITPTSKALFKFKKAQVRPGEGFTV
jgi:hypothetical protein